MGYRYNATGLQVNAQNISDGTYRFKIVGALPAKSMKGFYQVQCRLIFVGGEYDGKAIPWIHRVTFLPPTQPGAGIAVHFLQCIDQPHEGEFEIIPPNWVGKIFVGQILTKQNDHGELRSKITQTSNEVDYDKKEVLAKKLSPGKSSADVDAETESWMDKISNHTDFDQKR